MLIGLGGYTQIQKRREHVSKKVVELQFEERSKTGQTKESSEQG